MNITEARKLIATLADGKFRPAIPRSLLQVLGDHPPGMLVRLVNNEVGVITVGQYGHAVLMYRRYSAQR